MIMVEVLPRPSLAANSQSVPPVLFVHFFWYVREAVTTSFFLVFVSFSSPFVSRMTDFDAAFFLPVDP
jgi:hypothetical protein